MSPSAILAELRVWSPRQWRIAATVSVAAFLVMGIAGESLPGASCGRVGPVEWWNYVTLLASSLLIGPIPRTFVADRRSSATRFGGAGSGTLGTVTMACPARSPLAIPLFDAAGVPSFLAPARWLSALLSLMLAVTLMLRLRSHRSCELVGRSECTPAEGSTSP